MLTQAPKGTKDIFGDEIRLFRKIESEILDLCETYGYGEIKTPMFEHTELFLRGVGETTDIVQKEMYTFIDKGERSITLKPEGTAGVVRAFIENGMFNTQLPVKLFYLEPAFRYEAPQLGRSRQFYQFGVEAIGTKQPECDAEVISLVSQLIKRLGLQDIELQLNSLGCPSCRKQYNEQLCKFIEKNIDELCPTCKERFEKNPLRVLDCKDAKCKNALMDAPAITDMLDSDCTEHFETLKKLLGEMGISYEVNKRLVRGLDYYTRTVFEFVSTKIGAQSTICGGGRYDNLIEECGGQPQPAVGFGIGLSRLMMAVMANEKESEKKYLNDCNRDIFIGSIGEAGFYYAQKLVYNLRKIGIKADCDVNKRSVKAQLKYADKLKSKFSVILGDTELDDNKCSIKNMLTGEKFECNIDELVNKIR